MIVTIIGARPQFVKAAVVSKALKDEGLDEFIIHSGQHYDDKMSQIFWDELNIPQPRINLNIGSGSHAVQTADIMISLEKVLLQFAGKVKCLIVYGDTNTTLAGALTASKIGIPIVHIEAGLRSFNREMPEEINRVVTDHLSDVLFCPSQKAIENLKCEGIVNNIFNVGDVMYDCFVEFSTRAKETPVLGLVDTKQNTTLFTLHRPVNTDSASNIQSILNQIGKLPTQVIWPIHPRNKQLLGDLDLPRNVILVPPLSYLEILDVLNKCEKVITDSGGLQKEAYWAKKPCLTVRSETEWVETLKGGWNILTTKDTLAEDFMKTPSTTWAPLYGDGSASKSIAKVVKLKFHGKGN
jgi:UDP-GlcNAc3NAcA epimerase